MVGHNASRTWSKSILRLTVRMVPDGVKPVFPSKSYELGASRELFILQIKFQLWTQSSALCEGECILYFDFRINRHTLPGILWKMSLQICLPATENNDFSRRIILGRQNDFDFNFEYPNKKSKYTPIYVFDSISCVTCLTVKLGINRKFI